MCSRELVRSCILSYHPNKTSHMQLSFYTHLGSPLASWWFEISSLIAQECHTDYQLHLNTVFVQVHFVPSVLGFHRVWKARDVLLYCAGPTYSSSACLCAAAWCTLLFLRPTPNILVSKCKTVVVCIFLYFFCTSWRIAENISFAVWTQRLGWSYEWQDAKCLYAWKQMEGIHTACPSPLLYMETGCSFLSVAPFQKENILKIQCLYDILLYYFSSYFSSDVTIIHGHVFCFNDCWSSFGCLEANWFLKCL